MHLLYSLLASHRAPLLASIHTARNIPRAISTLIHSFYSSSLFQPFDEQVHAADVRRSSRLPMASFVVSLFSVFTISVRVENSWEENWSPCFCRVPCNVHNKMLNNAELSMKPNEWQRKIILVVKMERKKEIPMISNAPVFARTCSALGMATHILMLRQSPQNVAMPMIAAYRVYVNQKRQKSPNVERVSKRWEAVALLSSLQQHFQWYCIEYM